MLEVKESLLVRTSQVESYGVGVAERTSGSDNEPSNVNEELQVVWIDAWVCFTDKNYLFLYVFKLLLGELNRSLVLVVSIRVELQALHFSLNHSCV